MLGLTFESQQHLFSVSPVRKVTLPNGFYSNFLCQGNEDILRSKRLRTGMGTCVCLLKKPLINAI